ncbi:MAG TPA: hypothetical protein VGM10_03015 [Actinocrinis sp.]
MEDGDLVLRRRAFDACAEGDWPTAARIYEDLADRLPDGPWTSEWLYNAALGHKIMRDWARAYDLGRRAARLAERGARDPVFWNLGTAATVLGEWAVARDAWAGFGIEGIEPGEEEIEGDFGVACLRLRDETGRDEVVWAERLCPVRARVTGVPTQVAGHGFGDVIVHDVAPNGYRVKACGACVPVLDEVLVWQPGSLPTLRVRAEAPCPGDFAALAESFAERGLGFEPECFAATVCSCCSGGAVSRDHALVAGRQTLRIAAPRDLARSLLEDWRAAGAERRVRGEPEYVCPD